MKQTLARKLVTHFLMNPPSGVTLELQPDMYLRRGVETECERRVALINIKRVYGVPGTGALAMRELCSYADQLRVELVLSVTPKNARLLAYYRNFGFEPMRSKDEYHAMRRRPQALDGKVNNPTATVLSALRIAARFHDERRADTNNAAHVRLGAEIEAKEARQMLALFETHRAEIIMSRSAEARTT